MDHICANETGTACSVSCSRTGFSVPPAAANATQKRAQIISKDNAPVAGRLWIMRRVALAGIALLCSTAVFAQSGEEVRHHQAMDDALTGARVGEMTVIVRDQVYKNGAIDVLFSANGVDGVYVHRTLA